MASQIIPTFPVGGLDAAKIQGESVSLRDPTNGQALVWNSILQQYVPGTVVGSTAPVVSSGGMAALTVEQEAAITTGTIVTTTDGFRWVYSGAGSKLVEASYVELADITPLWASIPDKPSTFAPIIGSGAGDAVAGNDARLTNARTPSSTLAHASSHAAAGSDALTLTKAQISDFPTLGTGGPTSYTLKSADFVAVAGQSYAVDTSGGVVIATLPAAPDNGDVIQFADASSAWNDFHMILSPNGEKIFGRTGNFSLKTAALLATCVFVDGERGWAVFSGMNVPALVTAPTISGTETEFETLTATPGTWTNAPTEYHYQWQISANGTTGWADIEGATSSTYVLADGDGEQFVRVTVIAVNSAGDSDAEPSASSSEIVVLPIPANTDIPTLSGGETKDSTLTATSGTWENGTPTYGYQWQRSADGLTEWANITSATAATYVLGEDDVDAYVRVKVIATNAKGASDPAYSLSSGVITVATFPAGCLAFWKLDDLTDSSGNGNTLTNNGEVTVGGTSGIVGGGATFDGSTGPFLSSSIVPAITEAGISFSMWVKKAAAGGTIFSTQASGSFGLGMDFGTDNRPWGVQGNSEGWISVGQVGTENWSLDTWYHVVVTDDGTDLCYYVNGVLGLDSSSGNWLAEQFNLGFPFPGGSTPHNGEIDAVGIFDHALNTDEIALLYNAGAGAEPA